MAYPPTVPSNSRANTTPLVNDHPADHNAIADALTDIIAEIERLKDDVIPVAVPVGTVIPFAAATAPSGWLNANGAAVSRTTYADLFALIGTTYGVGDGSTTFNLPDVKSRTVIGRDSGDATFTTVGNTGGLRDATLVSHTHNALGTAPLTYWLASTFGSGDGLDSGSSGLTLVDPEDDANYKTGSEGVTATDRNLPPYIVLQYIIKV